jgi:hypothetical protein
MLKQRNKKILPLIFLASLFLFIAISKIVSVSDNTGTALIAGDNNVSFNVTSSFYAGDLIKLNPSIEAVSYRESNRTIGYVNAFGGIGSNFEIENGINYEIFVSENTTLVIPGS